MRKEKLLGLSFLLVVILATIGLAGITGGIKQFISVTANLLLWETDTDFNKGSLTSLEILGENDEASLQITNLGTETNNIDYETPGDYTVSSGSITVASGQAQLVILTGATTSYPFTSSGNYTFDSSSITVTGTVAELVRNTFPTDATLYSSFASTTNATFSDGSPVATSVGGADVSAGKLDLDNDDLRYLDYDSTTNFTGTQHGAIRVTITPNYSGSPATVQVFCDISNTSDNDNRVSIQQTTAGDLTAFVQNATGGNIFTIASPWSPTLGVDAVLEFSWNLDDGANYLFLDGVQLSSDTNTGTHTLVGLTTIRLGSNHTAVLNSNFKADDAILFSTGQHTANHTVATPPLDYDQTSPTIVNSTGFDFTAQPASFESTEVLIAGTSIGYTISLNDGSSFEFFNGSVWATADDTFAQVNSSTVINDNLSSLSSTSGTFKFKAFLHTTAPNSTPQLDLITVSDLITFSTEDNFFAETTNVSQVVPSTPVAWLTLEITRSLPSNTTGTILLSNDGRSTWQTFNGFQWVVVTDSVTRTVGTGFSDAEINIPSFSTGTGSFDTRVFLKTDISTTNLNVSNILVISSAGKVLAGEFTTNQFDSGNLDQSWGEFQVSSSVPDGTALDYSARAANTTSELSSATYTTIDFDDKFQFQGEFIQIKIDFTAISTTGPIVNNIGVEYITPGKPQRVAP